MAVVQSGEAAVSVGGKRQQSTVSRQDNRVVITVGEMTAIVSSVDTEGNTLALDAEGNIALEPGARVAIKVAGFEPGTEVEMWMFSTPVRLGTATVGADGTLDTVVVVPADVPNGAHRVVITTRSADDGDPVTFTLGIVVREFTKESNLATWLIVTPILLAVAAALFLPPAMRRRRRS